MSGLYDRLNEKTKTPEKKVEKQIDDPMTPSYHDPMTPSKAGTTHEAIRKAVRSVGKETTNYRLSSEEKEALKDLIYVFHKRKISTSENEIVRIALNQILGDYYENNDESVLVKVLERLNS